jgi:ubiquinone/menaquinone biosynthesis C-methylase UbiE
MKGSVVNTDSYRNVGSKEELWIGEDGWYQPYDFWLSLCGIYDLYAYALQLLGDMRGKRVLDCGCGPGHTSVMLAKRGAQVTAFDISAVQLETAHDLAAANGVSVEIIRQPFEQLDFAEESFDLAFGAFILHHVELAKASQKLSRLLRPGGRAVFIENSARNPILMAARRLLCGSFGIPRYSDDQEEHPLTRQDLEVLRKCFLGLCQAHYANFTFFRLADFYILQKRWPKLTTLLRRMDENLARFPVVRGYGYFQVIQLDKQEGILRGRRDYDSLDHDK